MLPMETMGMKLILMFLRHGEVDRLSVRSRIRNGMGVVMEDCVTDYFYSIIPAGGSYIYGL